MICKQNPANPNPTVAVIVDSAASLLPNAANRSGVYVVPMTLTLDGVSYLDGRDITPTQFYRRLKASRAIPTTSAPPPARYLDAFRLAESQRHAAILCIATAARFSAAMDSAAIAANELRRERPNLAIRLLDSQAAAGSAALAALNAWRASQSGASLAQTEQAALQVVKHVRLLAFVDTLLYLRRSGRVPAIAHAGASLLRIKPLFELANGDITTLARPRTRRSATARLLQLMRQKTTHGALHAAVMHADAPDDAQALRDRIAAEFRCAELFISEFTPVMGAHIGPGVLGVAFWSEP